MGTDILTRPAQELGWSDDLQDIPAPKHYPESEAHLELRKRISILLHGAPLHPQKVKVKTNDFYLFPTGMAAIHRLNQALL